MGVHDLWSIVEPVRESVPLYSLSGKTLAVDLSLWVCEAQHVQAMMGRVTKPHLRNLFFRVSTLTLMGIKLVFVMEGEAPKLKLETMSKRTETRYGGLKKSSKSAKTTNRGRFKTILRECAEMLDYLGVPWVTAAGEAEAMCAYLDSLGLVDGCITNDGDAFLYGARTVYKNFNMNSKDPQVDCYQTSRVQTDLRLSRENLVGLAILLGCDYIPKGIPGVGKEQSLRLIEALNGQSLLERFKQWKMVDTDAPDVVKKVLHCNICRHPGSAKAHENVGCVFCDSQRFCQPQDFDYRCPCEWHCYERTRQASTLEANIRRKTLASQQFPFTEIICEFLVSKDKPVSHFKRRQPNMLMMQKFAHEKMEWPKHYTSEKVLVLMTYTEMMNKKHGRDGPSQIKPIRIFKPRVRNGVASFEVIWSPPEHYVFPDDRPAEDQHEVRTVEEESLFRIAFPEIVESYLRSKALAKETKKKKPKARKEKSSDVSDDYLEIFGRMTLQSSSVTGSTQPQTLLPSTSSTQQTEVICLDTPESHKQLGKENVDHVGLGSPLLHAESPCISTVIDALHLSDINWDALSFTSSPTSQENHPAESQQSKTTSRDETRITEQTASSDVKQEDSRSAAELCYMECPLRDRVLMRNAAKAVNQVEKSCDVVSKYLNYESTPPKKALQEKQSADTSSTNCIYGGVVAQKSVMNNSQNNSFKDQPIPSLQTQNKTKETSDISKKPLKYKFVRTASSSSSDPGQSDKKSTRAPQTTKKSVCTSVRSSSDDSDTEKHQSGHQRRAKTNRIYSSLLSGVPLKQVSNQFKTTKSNPQTSHPLQKVGPTSLNHGEKVENDTPVSSKNERQDVQTPETGDDAFPPTPASPVADSKDSLICNESPLPLAERLRLKNLK